MGLIKIRRNDEEIFITEEEFYIERKEECEGKKLSDEFHKHLERYYPNIQEEDLKMSDEDYEFKNKQSELWYKFLFQFKGLDFKLFLINELGEPLRIPIINEEFEKDMGYDVLNYWEKEIIKRGMILQINKQTKINLINQTKKSILDDMKIKNSINYAHSFLKNIKNQLKQREESYLEI